jgi:hypothetical protein
VKRYLVLFLIAHIFFKSFSQVGGDNTYEFLNLTNSAKVAALGGKVISIDDDDLATVFHNPSLLNASMHNNLVLNYVNYFADINYGYVSYARSLGNKGDVAAGMHYINYGEFIEADETGQITGSFKAAEYALNLFWSKAIDSNFTVGANVKPLYSVLERYSSFGILADLGVTYHNRKQLFTAAFVIKNFGTQIKPYNKQNYEPVPFEMQLGITKQLAHAPFRFTFTGHQLQKPDMTYEKDEVRDPLLEEQERNPLDIYADMFMRHIIAGVELIITDGLTFRVGYNHQRRKELQVESNVSTVGFSWGFGVKVYKFHVNFGRATYHLAGASNHFSITTDINSFTQVKP